MYVLKVLDHTTWRSESTWSKRAGVGVCKSCYGRSVCVKDIHKSRCVTLPSSLHLDIPALVIPAHCFVFFTITQNTGLFHRTGLPSPCPGRGLRCLLTFFTINPEHWSFSPNWTCFTLAWAWTSMPLDFLHH